MEHLLELVAATVFQERPAPAGDGKVLPQPAEAAISVANEFDDIEPLRTLLRVNPDALVAVEYPESFTRFQLQEAARRGDTELLELLCTSPQFLNKSNRKYKGSDNKTAYSLYKANPNHDATLLQQLRPIKIKWQRAAGN